jgi:hypothetical protein
VSRGRDVRRDLEAEAPDEIVRLAERLQEARPVPSAAFRGELRRRLLVVAGASRPRPARLRALIAGYAGAGAMLLLAGVASAAGLGPLGT